MVCHGRLHMAKLYSRIKYHLTHVCLDYRVIFFYIKIWGPCRSMVATGGFRRKTHLESLEQELEIIHACMGDAPEDGIPSTWASIRVRHRWDLASNPVEGFFVASDGACACDTPIPSPCRGNEVSSYMLAPRGCE